MQPSPNADQRAQWNDLAGPKWVAMQPQLDHQLAPFTDDLLATLPLAEGHRVLDVGCGCGATSLAVARRVGPSGAVYGVDLSLPMLARARERAAEAQLANALFAACDAQTDAFPDAPYDALVSRFGVMFFDAPARAFRHLRSALRPGAPMAFVCWQSPARNAWVTVPLRAAQSVVGEIKLPPPETPGPFAFADAERVASLLAEAGWTNVTFAPKTYALSVGGGTSLDEAVAFLLQVGPTARAVGEAPPGVRTRVRDSLRDALADHVVDGGVRLDGAAWLVTARAAG